MKRRKGSEMTLKSISMHDREDLTNFLWDLVIVVVVVLDVNETDDGVGVHVQV